MTPRGKNSSAPCIVNLGVNVKENTKIYDDWAPKYAKDIRDWGYDMPEQVAELLSKHFDNVENVLDAGAGDGLSGVALRRLDCLKDATILANDVSSNMLDVAKTRACYNECKVVDLNDTPYPYETNQFDVVTCIGTLTYLDASKGVLQEFVRTTRPQGLVCYTNRTDHTEKWTDVERQLEQEGKWEVVKITEPLPYLPGNPDYGEDVQVTIRLFRVL